MQVRGKMRFGASYSTSNKLLPVARHILTTGLQKYLESWHCKICKVTVTAFHCEESTHRKKKQPRDLSDAGQKSRELTTPPELPKKHLLRAYLEMSPKCFTTATILHSFSSVQTHCAPVVCCAEWVTSFPVHFEYQPKWSQCCLVVTSVEIAAMSAHVLCTLHNHASLQCHFIWSYIHRVKVRLAVTCHQHFWHNDCGLLMRYCGNMDVGGGGGGRDTEINVSTESWPCRISFSHGSPSPRSFNHKSGALPLSYPNLVNHDLENHGAYSCQTPLPLLTHCTHWLPAPPPA